MHTWHPKPASFMQAFSSARLWAGVWLALFVSISLSGCGFHLRGTDARGQLQATHLVLHEQAGVRPAIMRALTRQLEQAGVKVFTSEATAEPLPVSWQAAPSPTIWHIRLSATHYEVSSTAQRLGDVTAQLMRMQQPFEVYTLESKATQKTHGFASSDQALQANKATRLFMAKVNAYRDRTIQIDAFLASESEKREFQQSMSRELAQKIVNRLRQGQHSSTLDKTTTQP